MAALRNRRNILKNLYKNTVVKYQKYETDRIVAALGTFMNTNEQNFSAY